MAAPKKYPILPYVWPEKPLCSTAYYIDERKGESFKFLSQALQTFPLFASAEQYNIAHLNTLPQKPCENGHNVLTTYSGENWCFSPLFVKDLAGRVVHIGAGMTKPRSFVFFPEHTQDVHENVLGVDFIEHSFFVNFVPLEFSQGKTFITHHSPDSPQEKTYQNPHHYPYKLRIDSFYQDGWRLPQTERLYIKSYQGQDSEKAVGSFLHAWKNRPPQQSYLDFVEAHGGAEWFESFYQRGATVIPTFEACNGYYIVNDAFELTDFHNGMAVHGLHEIVGEKPDNAPKGTILDVIQPGIATQQEIYPAKVVVSNGKGYALFNGVRKTLRPDLTLPHPKLHPDYWQKYWIPTQPSHFEPPALFDWHTDEEGTRFIQVSGPIWEPLHYVYKSTPKIIKAFRHPYLENMNFAPVPEEMKLLFHPVTELHTYDTFDELSKDYKEQMGVRPATFIDRIPYPKAAQIGYHPLPEGYLPPLSYTETPECPEKFQNVLCYSITPTVSPDDALKSVKTFSDPCLFWHDANLYQGVIPSWLGLKREQPELPYCEKGLLQQNIHRAVGGKTAKANIESLGVPIYEAYYDFRYKSLTERRRLYRKYSS